MIYVFNREEELVAILSNDEKEACPFYDAEVHEVLGGEFTFEFKVPGFHDIAKEIEERFFVAFQDTDGRFQLFVIQEIEDEHGEIFERSIYCENAIVELQDTVIIDAFIDRKTAVDALPVILSGTRWEAGSIASTGNHTYTITKKTVLEALQVFVDRWGGELNYYVEIEGQRITRRVIDHVDRVGTDTGKRFEYSKDLESISRTIDTTEIKTRLQGFGIVKGEDANGEATEEEIEVVVEDDEARVKYGIFNHTTGLMEHRTGIHEAGEVTGNIELTEILNDQLEQAKVPRMTYKVKAVDLFSLTGLVHEEIRKGDTVIIIDRELEIQIEARIIERTIDLIFPEFNEYELGNFRPVFTEGIQELERGFEESRREWKNKLDRGETIKTTWLEDEINLLQKKLLTGSGTVTLTENDGILITDKPLDQAPTKALRLMGGMLGIANSKIQGTDNFDFRTFGTGDGFTAEEITTGTFRFDRSKGGTLTLGGELIETTESGKPVYEHGILNVLDENGEIIITLDGSQGGFDRLHVGELSASNVSLRTKEDFHLYVNHKHGSPNNDGLDPSRPLSSIQEALERIPKHVDHDIRIIVDNNIYTNLLTANQSSQEASLDGIRAYSTSGIINTNRTTSRPAKHGSYSRWVQYRDTGTAEYMALTTDGTNTPCSPGQWYTMSTFIQQSGGKPFRIVALFYDDTGNLVQEEEGELQQTTITAEWLVDPISITVKSPVNASAMGFEVRMYDVVDYDYFYIDALQIVENSLVQPFTLGGTENTTGRNTITEADIRIDGFNGAGYVRIYLGERNTIEGEIVISGCNAEIYIATKEGTTLNNDNRAILFNANASGYRGIIQTYRCAYIYVTDIFTIDNKGQTAYCIMSYNSYLRLINVEGYESFHSVFCGAYGSRMYVNNCKGTAPRGLYCHGSSTLGGNGTAPRGTSTNIHTAEGGGVFFTGWTHDSGSNPLSNYEPLKTTTWTPNDYWGYNSNTGWTKGTVINGKRPTDPPIWYGVFYFNLRDFGELKNSDGTLRPIHSVRFKARRTSNTGDNTSRKPNFHWSNKTTADGSAPAVNNPTRSNVGFSWGEQKWITLPIIFGEKFRDGTAKSLVVYDGSRTEDYMKFELEGVLEIVHG